MALRESRLRTGGHCEDRWLCHEHCEAVAPRGPGLALRALWRREDGHEAKEEAGPSERLRNVTEIC